MSHKVYLVTGECKFMSPWIIAQFTEKEHAILYVDLI